MALLATFSVCHIQESAVGRNVVGLVARLEGFDGRVFLSVSQLYEDF